MYLVFERVLLLVNVLSVKMYLVFRLACKCGILNGNMLFYLSHIGFVCKAAITVQLVLVFAMVDSVFRKVTLVFGIWYGISTMLYLVFQIVNSEEEENFIWCMEM